MKKTIGMLGVASAILGSNLVHAAGETGEVSVSQVKVASNYTQVFFEAGAENPDNCGSSTSVIVSSHSAKREIYSSAMAAMNAKLPAYFDVNGCSTAAGGSSIPVVTAITVGAQ